MIKKGLSVTKGLFCIYATFSKAIKWETSPFLSKTG
jgi:hypothetical protein